MNIIKTRIKASLPRLNALAKSKRQVRTSAVAATIAILSTLSPNSGASAQHINVSVNWNTTLKSIDPGAWGVNAPSFMVPSDTGNAGWMSLVNDITLKKPLIRIHGWGMLSPGAPDCWLNADKTWNAAKIVKALTPVVKAGYKIMIDVPDGPNFSQANAPDPDLIGNPDKIAAWMASLVKIVNVDNHLGV